MVLYLIIFVIFVAIAVTFLKVVIEAYFQAVAINKAIADFITEMFE